LENRIPKEKRKRSKKKKGGGLRKIEGIGSGERVGAYLT